MGVLVRPTRWGGRFIMARKPIFRNAKDHLHGASSLLRSGGSEQVHKATKPSKVFAGSRNCVSLIVRIDILGDSRGVDDHDISCLRAPQPPSSTSYSKRSPPERRRQVAQPQFATVWRVLSVSGNCDSLRNGIRQPVTCLISPLAQPQAAITTNMYKAPSLCV